jgi:Tfp pilus assembly protein FimV
MGVFVGLPTWAAEPIVILEYRQDRGAQIGEDSTHPFRMDPNYSARHRVRKDETLSHVIANFYSGSGIDRAFVQMAIIRKNRPAFVRGNPNYLFADKVLHLPSLNEIRAMLVKQSSPEKDADMPEDNRNHIFFFGS